MRYRPAGAPDVLRLLDELARRHRHRRFFAVDLIISDTVKDEVCVELARRDEPVELFYEIKADVSRDELERMSTAGIRWIQPGIESMSDRVLGLMRKGTTVAHNLQLLKWSSELDIRVSWNLLLGQPGEREEDYDGVWSLLPRLFHLQPPSGVGLLQIHRFSPIFDELGGSDGGRLRPKSPYEEVFDLDESILRRLAYVFDDVDARDDHPARLVRMQRLVDAWRRQHRAGARLQWLDDFSIEDRRLRRHYIVRPDGLMAELLEAADQFRDPAELIDLVSAPVEVVEDTIDRAVAAGLGVRHRRRFMSLVLPAGTPPSPDQRVGPVRYLTDADEILATT